MEETKKVDEQNAPKMVELSKVQEVMVNIERKYQTEIQRLTQMLSDKTLDYYFKVLEYSANFDTDFVLYSADTITRALTPKQEEPVAGIDGSAHADETEIAEPKVEKE